MSWTVVWLQFLELNACNALSNIPRWRRFNAKNEQVLVYTCMVMTAVSRVLIYLFLIVSWLWYCEVPKIENLGLIKSGLHSLVGVSCLGQACKAHGWRLGARVNASGTLNITFRAPAPTGFPMSSWCFLGIEVSRSGSGSQSWGHLESKSTVCRSLQAVAVSLGAAAWQVRGTLLCHWYLLTGMWFQGPRRPAFSSTERKVQ